jgi:DNA-binding response OmpR family regulator
MWIPFDILPARAMKHTGNASRTGIINVLIVEPDQGRCEKLVSYLSREAGFRIVGAGEDFLYVSQIPILRRLPADVLLIDIDQPEMAQIGAWAAIHVVLPRARIAALTTGKDDRVLRMALGAGVFALHPLDVEPDVLRRAVRCAAQGVVDYDPSLAQRAKRRLLEPLGPMQIRFGGLTIDLQTQEVIRWGRPIHLTPLECQVLAYLGRNRGEWVSTTELLSAVWHAPAGTAAQVKNCIKRLRRKIEPGVKHPRYIQSRRGWGYILRDPLEPPPDPSGASSTTREN